MEAPMEEQKNHILPLNYVTIIQLKQRWLEEKEQRQRELEKPEEQNRDERQEIQPGELGEMPEEMRLMVDLNFPALEIDSKVRNPYQNWKSTHNRSASVKNQGAAEASRRKEELLVVDVKLDGPPDKGSENKANDLELAVKRKRRKRYGKNKQTILVDEKNPKSEGEPTQDLNCEVAMKHREHLPEVNDKKVRGRERNTDEKKITEDEYGPKSSNVDQILEIGGKSRHFSINDETKTKDNRFRKDNNGIRQGYRHARANVRLNRHEVQKETGGAFIWVRKGETSSSGVSNGFHSRVSGGSIDGPSVRPVEQGKAKQVIDPLTLSHQVRFSRN